MTISSHDNPVLFGHDEAEARWLTDMQGGKLAHGWIISGPKGIGKATLAHRIARAMLAGHTHFDMSPDDSVFRRISSGAHADFLLVEPAFDEKKGEQKEIINVEQAREVAKFLSLTPAESRWRIVIIDSADALNPNAANAILKTLEEPPPQALLLLISHNPASLLPTIRSRCAMLKLSPLSNDHFDSAMTHLFPDMEPEKHRALAVLADGSPGLAASFEMLEAVEMYDALLDLLKTLPELDPLAVHGFADQFSGTQVHTRFKLLGTLILCLFARVSKVAAGMPVAPIHEAEKEVLLSLADLHSAAGWAEKWQETLAQFSLAGARHLDYKQVIIVFLHNIMNKDKPAIAL